jgi:hypothetical protein
MYAVNARGAVASLHQARRSCHKSPPFFHTSFKNNHLSLASSQFFFLFCLQGSILSQNSKPSAKLVEAGVEQVSHPWSCAVVGGFLLTVKHIHRIERTDEIVARTVLCFTRCHWLLFIRFIVTVRLYCIPRSNAFGIDEPVCEIRMGCPARARIQVPTENHWFIWVGSKRLHALQDVMRLAQLPIVQGGTIVFIELVKL